MSHALWTPVTSKTSTTVYELSTLCSVTPPVGVMRNAARQPGCDAVFTQADTPAYSRIPCFAVLRNPVFRAPARRDPDVIQTSARRWPDAARRARRARRPDVQTLPDAQRCPYHVRTTSRNVQASGRPDAPDAPDVRHAPSPEGPHKCCG
eukprot:5576907-Prymnesium_polylepis.1